MFLELVRESENTAGGGIAGRLFVDGKFFGYTLENAATAIPEGDYNLYTRFSPKFNANKLAIDVPGRDYIQFHGGNAPEDSAGCVLVARQRTDTGNIYGDLSGELYTLAKDDTEAGTAKIKVRRETKNGLLIFVAVAAAAIFFITR